MKILNTILFTEDYRCFKSGEKYNFRDGLNVLVGDQGTGKSSLIKVMTDGCDA